MRWVVAALLLFVVAISAPLALLYRAAAAYRPLPAQWQPVGVDRLSPGAAAPAALHGGAALSPAQLRACSLVLGAAALAALLGALSALAGRAPRAGWAAALLALLGLAPIVAWGPAGALGLVAVTAALLGTAGQAWSAYRKPRCARRAAQPAGR